MQCSAVQCCVEHDHLILSKQENNVHVNKCPLSISFNLVGRLKSQNTLNLIFIFTVNNAGIGLVGVLEEQSWEAIMNTYNTNVFGVFRLLRAIIPSMKKNKKGRIINISSVGGLVGLPFNTVYGSTKFALEGITECLAPQLAQFNVQ